MYYNKNLFKEEKRPWCKTRDNFKAQHEFLRFFSSQWNDHLESVFAIISKLQKLLWSREVKIKTAITADSASKALGNKALLWAKIEILPTRLLTLEFKARFITFWNVSRVQTHQLFKILGLANSAVFRRQNMKESTIYIFQAKVFMYHCIDRPMTRGIANWPFALSTLIGLAGSAFKIVTSQPDDFIPTIFGTWIFRGWISRVQCTSFFTRAKKGW